MKPYKKILFFLALSIAITANNKAFANGSTAAIGAGGLTLTKTEEIAMKREVLKISQEQITVDYTFENLSDKDIKTIVAFPIPQIDSYSIDLHVGTGSGTGDIQKDLMSFTIVVDGKSVEPQIQLKAFIVGPSGKKDISDLLKSLNVPLYTGDPNLWKSIEALTADQKKKLVAQGVLYHSEVSPFPQWSLEVMFYWEQTFKARGTLQVSHSYHPSVGSVDTDHKKSFTKDFCPKGVNIQPMLSYQYVDYILTTAKGWKGPIGSFELEITATKQDPFVSLCSKDLTLTRKGLTYSVTKKNYVPSRELSIAFYNNRPWR